MFYNIRGGKQVSYIDMLDATEGFPGLDDEPAPGDSAETPDAKKKPDTVSGVRLLNGVVEHTIQKSNPMFIFINGLFGCVFIRDKENEK